MKFPCNKIDKIKKDFNKYFDVKDLELMKQIIDMYIKYDKKARKSLFGYSFRKLFFILINKKNTKNMINSNFSKKHE